MANDEAAPEVPPLEPPATAPHRPQTFRFSRPLRYFIRALVFLALSYDHRIIDGADAARFLSQIKNRLEEGAFEGNLGL